MKPVEDKPNYKFVKGDIADEPFIMDLFEKEKFDIVVNFAAESHVDRSIEDPGIFVQTNVMGTRVLLDASKKYGVKRYHQVSTNEVYGDLPLTAGPVLHRGNTDSHFKPLFLLKGQRRFICTCLLQNLWTAGDHFQMFQQLWSLSFSGKTDSADDQPRPGR